MTDKYGDKLKNLGFELPEWCFPPSEKLVAQFERDFGVKLPNDYRNFLVHHGGVIGNCECPFQEPTPCGKATIINSFYGFSNSNRGDSVEHATKLVEGAPDVVAIGDNLIGAMFWLKCTGVDAGCVYMHDHEMRSSWADEQFAEWFSNLSFEVKEYLELRKKGKLQPKPRGYDHVYRIGQSFDEFMESLRPAQEQS